MKEREKEMREKGGMIYEDECYQIRGALYEVYTVLGTGFAEEVYHEALEKELTLREIPFESQKILRISYKDEWLSKTYKTDMVCYDKIILELKAVTALLPEHEAQLLNYLKATGMRLGFLVNFCHFPKADIRTYAN
jgi:GxxExxY protein